MRYYSQRWKLHVLTWNQDSAYVCSYICSSMCPKNYLKTMKLWAENQFPRWSTVSLSVVLPTWDNNRFYLIILLESRVKTSSQDEHWWRLETPGILYLSSSPGVIRPDLINAWLIQTFHILNNRLSLCETFYLLRCQIYAWYLSGNTFAGPCAIQSIMVNYIAWPKMQN